MIRTSARSRHAVYTAVLLLLANLLQGCARETASVGASPLAGYSGKWIVLNYWAEWCAPCIEEIPELNRLQREHGQALTVLGVNFDGIEGEELAQLSADMGIEFQVLEQDPRHALRLSRPAALPTTYLFEPGGSLAAVLVGPQSASSLLERIASLQAREANPG